MPAPRTVALVTLGCARNEVDSEELAGRLAADGWTLVADAAEADVALVNTCGFIEAAKKDSIDTILAAAQTRDDSGPAGGGRARAVVAVGCLAERYGDQLAAALPEADAVLGFDDYAAISQRLADTLAGRPHVPHAPRDRRALLPLQPVERPSGARAAQVAVPGHASAQPPSSTQPVPDLPAGVAPASGPRPLRQRLADGPVAPLKLASGCDRRCAFCAIPSFRGSFLSRPDTDLLVEAGWLADHGVRELVLVSENSTSYGKDLGDVRLLESLLPRLAGVAGIERVRVSYLQPAELRPGLIEVIAGTPGVAPYFDLSFQHASAGVLRRMRRFGDVDRFLELLGRIRQLAPQAGVRSNFIVGFPGETEADLADLERFLTEARLDAIGVFGYSDEEGTEAAGYDGKLDAALIDERLAQVSWLAEELTAQRAAERIGERVEVLVEQVGAEIEGRAAHQAPEVDGTVTLRPEPGGPSPAVGQFVPAVVVDSMGVDLLATPLAAKAPA
jgi:ribosomal protein S12 methylthiotransferase RimO